MASLQEQIKAEEDHPCADVFTAVKEETESVNISGQTDKDAVKEEAETEDVKEEGENWTLDVNDEPSAVEIGMRAESPCEIEVKLEPGSESEESLDREPVPRSKGRKRAHPLQQQQPPQNRKGLEVTDADFELLRSMTGTPISYLANQPPLLIAVGENTYPLGCGLSYQLPSMSTVSNPQDDA
ncbi:uncharacterized protein LOC118821195 isoform X4 [Colossoma macropomum]|uniref:uncharacterized protein LOC118821195 isoform X4 n=1 Tax=Colossoma macropomum TaxID=42526 RepID=UPI001864AE21|nr:uncharacterized protein LOC118821195 isoform X4 [Colossoma macropomum]